VSLQISELAFTTYHQGHIQKLNTERCVGLWCTSL